MRLFPQVGRMVNISNPLRDGRCRVTCRPPGQSFNLSLSYNRLSTGPTSSNAGSQRSPGLRQAIALGLLGASLTLGAPVAGMGFEGNKIQGITGAGDWKGGGRSPKKVSYGYQENPGAGIAKVGCNLLFL